MAKEREKAWQFCKESCHLSLFHPLIPQVSTEHPCSLQSSIQLQRSPRKQTLALQGWKGCGREGAQLSQPGLEHGLPGEGKACTEPGKETLQEEKEEF